MNITIEMSFICKKKVGSSTIDLTGEGYWFRNGKVIVLWQGDNIESFVTYKSWNEFKKLNKTIQISSTKAITDSDEVRVHQTRSEFLDEIEELNAHRKRPEPKVRCSCGGKSDPECDYCCMLWQ